MNLVKFIFSTSLIGFKYDQMLRLTFSKLLKPNFTKIHPEKKSDNTFSLFCETYAAQWPMQMLSNRMGEGRVKMGLFLLKKLAGCWGIRGPLGINLFQHKKGTRVLFKSILYFHIK